MLEISHLLGSHRGDAAELRKSSRGEPGSLFALGQDMGVPDGDGAAGGEWHYHAKVPVGTGRLDIPDQQSTGGGWSGL
jgi:hypothetical protein